MLLTHTIIREDALEIHEIEGEGDVDFVHDFSISEDNGFIVVLIEKIRGAVYSNLRDQGENLARDAREKVELYLYRPSKKLWSLSLRIKAKGDSAFRATVGFFKRTIENANKDLTCKACKAVCKLLVSTILASIGIPYLDGAEAADAVDQAVSLKEYRTGIEALADNPVAPDHRASSIGELMARIDPSLLKGIRFALDAMNWYLDATDKIYTFACAQVGCCQPPKS
ncbi:hypothetical protein GFB56_12490 [Ensifer sp. T173]|uniref:Uncharacterized protein n=1 Tax=Ensifer canadensis TaxID=555315 RepID=A0AAW4FKY9_9HYPH|nr:hypothetical protein [Ensifer canadensis]MBM3091631.1 hypothetical protein [Ensifer canadensis]UBI74381.1 hypothetical protein J3R84_12860 [Ensifer canadensis]